MKGKSPRTIWPGERLGFSITLLLTLLAADLFIAEMIPISPRMDATPRLPSPALAYPNCPRLPSPMLGSSFSLHASALLLTPPHASA